ncbi:hypothetical protein P6144_09885 [Sphingomonas sp. HITSZ_GF]|uniref:hypothetical protein n=1 Tax=Sphingomonas sp. HITSZ_GF TaxID=3037247 RepID=UPI00240E3EF6|nr:hypothetical protein [Sphingomonas sp. HITSZ_GF]MDG2533955.1 hypothetical protein [Sphingomonas sp. HITSZ_GF]
MPEEEKVQRSGARIGRGKALAALAALAFLLAILPHKRLGLDLQLGVGGARAVLDLGLVSFRIAFDSGRSCPESNSCTGLLR